MLSFSRIAAFEFLIRFRSVGNGANLRAARSIRRVATASRESRDRMVDATTAARNYQRSLQAVGVSARSAARASNLYFSQLRRNGASFTPQDQQRRTRTAARIRGARNFRNATSGRLANIGGSLFGSRGRVAGARAAVGIGALRKGLSKLHPILLVASTAFSVLFSAIRTGISLYASFAKLNIIILAGFGLVGAAIARISDNYTNLTNRIRAATGGQVEIAGEMQKIAAIANRARAPLDVVAEVYGRVALNAEAYGISLEKVAQFTELAAKAAKIGGASTREQSQAFIQLAQGIGSNRLSGDELRSVREQTPELAASIARGFKDANGKIGVSFGDLKKLGEEGKLTSQQVIEAVIRDSRIIELRFGSLEATFADSAVVFKSSLSLFAGSVLSALKLGPRAFKFFDSISEKFLELSKNSGSVALALSRLPKFFNLLGFSGAGRLFSFFERLGEFLTNIPEKISEFADNINEFVSAVENGVSLEDAASLSFGLNVEDLQNSTLIKFFGKDAPETIERSLSTFVSTLDAAGKAIAGFTAIVNKFTTKEGLTDLALSSTVAGQAIQTGRRLGGVFEREG